MRLRPPPTLLISWRILGKISKHTVGAPVGFGASSYGKSWIRSSANVEKATGENLLSVDDTHDDNVPHKNGFPP